MKNTLKSSDVSFVVQGPVAFNKSNQNTTEELVRCLKASFPDSPIIFSTWENEDATGFKDCLVVKSRDPGPDISLADGQGLASNINRQIMSTRAGLEKVSTKYCMKLRSDLSMTNNRSLKILNSRPIKYKSEFSVTDEYVVIIDFTSIDASKDARFLFHPCDWIWYGLTSDLLDIWTIDSITESDCLYFRNRSPEDFLRTYGSYSRFQPEAWIWSSFLKKKTLISFDTSVDSTDCKRSNDFIFANLMPVTLSELGLKSDKYPQNFFQKGSLDRFFRFTRTINYQQWSKWYRLNSGVRPPYIFLLESQLSNILWRLSGVRLYRWASYLFNSLRRKGL